MSSIPTATSSHCLLCSTPASANAAGVLFALIGRTSSSPCPMCVAAGARLCPSDFALSCPGSPAVYPTPQNSRLPSPAGSKLPIAVIDSFMPPASSSTRPQAQTQQNCHSLPPPSPRAPECYTGSTGVLAAELAGLGRRKKDAQGPFMHTSSRILSHAICSSRTPHIPIPRSTGSPSLIEPTCLRLLLTSVHLGCIEYQQLTFDSRRA